MFETIPLSEWLHSLPIDVIRAVCAFLIRNLNDYRTGFPDLFLSYGPGEFEFVEVKGPGGSIATSATRMATAVSRYAIACAGFKAAQTMTTKVAVRQLAEFAFRQGDLYPIRQGRGVDAREGIDTQQQIQMQRKSALPGFEAEVSVALDVDFAQGKGRLTGRIDELIRDESGPAD